MFIAATPRALLRVLAEEAPESFSFSVVDHRYTIRIVVRTAGVWRVLRVLTFGLATRSIERRLLATACEHVPAGIAVEMVVL